ncbi:2-methylfumaryl-CoA hydratase [Halosimplex pelagicum]|uniref:Acyl dehydratase n=1 Tax=Halosimplex pelagicum TaxID=869886 RepID=A0A7D5PBR8_9EURY|nr:2-methylfumaryl-CoA hydratase [Halosimplex pelagicum]QLH84421.1 acyl dehydratase [Halosimplex pelagicum]
MTDWTDPDTFAAALDHVDTREKGRYFEDFAEGQVIEHAPGLRLTRHGNDAWMGQTLNHDPAYWRSDAARARGFDEPPIHPDYLLAAVMGPSVEDLSEKGGYFLGRDAVRFHEHGVAPGTEPRVESTVRATGESSSRPEYGIVTWETHGRDADGDTLVSYERTNMIPRREPAATDGGRSESSREEGDGSRDSELPETFVTPDGGAFEDFRRALDRAADRDAAVAYRHERGRTMDELTVAALPLATLNTARQHHNGAAMADSPSGEPVAYGDVTRSTALGHARSDERTYRELGFDDERFHDFVTAGDTVFGFTRVLDADPSAGPPRAGQVTFEHVAFTADERPVYSGRRRALIDREDADAPTATDGSTHP